MSAALFACVLALFTQPEVVRNFVGEPELGTFRAGLKAVWFR